MTHNPSPDWHRRHLAGETYTQIAKSAHVSRNRVAGAIKRHRDELAGRSAPRRTPNTPRAPSPPIVRPIKPDIELSKAKRQAVDRLSLDRFSAAVEARECLWWDGDLRDGSAAFCGASRGRGRYCPEHGARAFKDRPAAS
ncbi:GcrA family cell cycle regulator [Rhodopila sp.]|uniref:GcrA family cell cycle regulator n=1 Tax=Rhodopila sp. TaxID=2480087 RepID=UPI003D0FE367